MTDRQNEKLNMHQTVLNYCREHAGVYAGIPAFIRGVDELEGWKNKKIAGSFFFRIFASS
ncbi:MAG: hypothetical protein LBL04_02300 [Bacteroidales bacterium]|jgi:hypothetical protein|nr:hypothetical protein [Bacteroidales bacterium]